MLVLASCPRLVNFANIWPADAPNHPAWLHEPSFLLEAGAKSVKTETTYRSGLRLFADWLQQFKRDNYVLDDPWPLSPAALTTASMSWL